MLVITIPLFLTWSYRAYLAVFEKERFRELMIERHPDWSEFALEYSRRREIALFLAFSLVVIMNLIYLFVAATER
jgi:hypothetical protein